MDFNELTDEQKANACACTTAEELNAATNAAGEELSDDLLEGVAGGLDLDGAGSPFGMVGNNNPVSGPQGKCRSH